MTRHLSMVLALCAGTLSADVTVRYKMEMKSPMIAAVPQAAEQLKNLPSEIVLSLKGVKGRSDMGPTVSILDTTTKQMTVLDTTAKKYVETTGEEYLTALTAAAPALSPAVKEAMASLKVKADSKMTGRTATIQGIEGEEREITLLVDGPAMPNTPPGPMMRVVISAWLSKESEAGRVPGIRELSALAKASGAGTLDGLKKILDMFPGMGDSMQSLVQDLTKPNALMLKMHMDMFMPMIAEAMKQMPAGASPFGAGFDANGPLMQMNEELTELSTSPVADSQFQVPAGYVKEPIDDFVKDYLARMTAAAK